MSFIPLHVQLGHCPCECISKIKIPSILRSDSKQVPGILQKMLTSFEPIGTWVSKLERDEANLSLVPVTFFVNLNNFQHKLELSTLRPVSTGGDENVLFALKNTIKHGD